MLSKNNRFERKIDPWVASSLLQKAIRRGESERACHAAANLYRLRGKGIWKRLVTIAFEDVGIADPKLLLDLVSLASDERLRATIGTEPDLLDEICIRLAKSPKDRSADYVFSIATRCEPCMEEHQAQRRAGLNSLMSVVRDEGQPLVRKARAILELATIDGAGERLIPPTKIQKLLDHLFGDLATTQLINATFLAAQMRAHPIVLLPLLLNSESVEDATVVEARTPPADVIGGVPLYAFDKFTSVGKQAIGLFARECPELRAILTDQCAERDWSSVAAMGVFYAEGYLTARQFNWNMSRRLESLGMRADFAHAGANLSNVSDIVRAVGSNLPFLNQIRRRLLTKRGAR